MTTEREWRHTLDHLAQGDDDVAAEAERELEAATLSKAAAHSDVKSAFMTMADGSIVDKDELIG